MRKLNLNKKVRKEVDFTVPLKKKPPFSSKLIKFIGNKLSYFKRFFIFQWWVDENHQLLNRKWQTSQFFKVKMKKAALKFLIELFLPQMLKFKILKPFNYLADGTFTLNIPIKDRSVFLHDWTAVEVSGPVMKLDSGKANRRDEKPIENLKPCAHAAAQTFLFESKISVSQGVFPHSAKSATITLINKSVSKL